MNRYSLMVALFLVVTLVGTLVPTTPARAQNITIINNFGVTPFLYGGYAYVPLRSVADFIGAALIWNALDDQVIVIYSGRTFYLSVGSPLLIFGGANYYLPLSPIYINHQICVPTTFFVDYVRVPCFIDRDRHRVRFEGLRGWGALPLITRPDPTFVRRISRQVYAAPGRSIHVGGERIRTWSRGMPRHTAPILRTPTERRMPSEARRAPIRLHERAGRTQRMERQRIAQTPRGRSERTGLMPRTRAQEPTFGRRLGGTSERGRSSVIGRGQGGGQLRGTGRAERRGGAERGKRLAERGEHGRRG